MADRIGQQLGHYRLVRRLGEGGFATVYLGEHIYLNTPAAIKVLATRLAEDDVEQFRSEARFLANLKHPHIVRVLDFGLDGATPFLVMEYAAGGTLRKLHPRGSHLPLSLVVSYVKQVADALQYAHDRKLIHRDIKPENMLVGEQREILLSDFGIALISQSSQVQGVQTVAGTAYYMAPEQYRGRPKLASDQYALGIVVYEWLSGTPPFQGSFLEMASQHLFGTLPSLCEQVPGLPLSVEQVVFKALAKDPALRFASVREFAQALEVASWPSLPTANMLRTSHSEVGAAETQPEFTRYETIRRGDITQISSTPPSVSPVERTQRGRRRGIIAAAFTAFALLLIASLLLSSAAGGVFAIKKTVATTPPTGASHPSCNSSFSDDFHNQYNSRWVRKGDVTDSTISVTGQGLQIFIPHSDKNLWPNSGDRVYNYDAPRLLQPIMGNFTIETRVDFDPQYAYQGAGLLIWQDPDHFLRLEFARAEGRGIEFDQVNNGNAFRLVHAGVSSPTNNVAPVIIAPAVKQVDLRLQRDGNAFTASWRVANSDSAWHILGSTIFALTNLQVGPLLVNYTNSDNQSIQADFTYFHITCM
ncbi:MAG: protein kinase [Chloroflexi bacterium]|nr:protein kinase [Chloroflexota bacterium]